MSICPCVCLLLAEPLTDEGGEETGVPGETQWRHHSGGGGGGGGGGGVWCVCVCVCVCVVCIVGVIYVC